MAKGGHSMHYCKRCLNGFTSRDALTNHQTYCNEQAAVKVVLPRAKKDDHLLYFKNYRRSMRAPYVIYCDFESSIQPIDTTQPKPDEPYMNKIQRHIPMSFYIYVKCFDDSVYSSQMVTFTAENEDDDVGQIFVDRLVEITKQIYNQTKSAKKMTKKMIYTEEDKKNFESATLCHICERELGEDRVRDHCHLTGKYRGAAH